MRRLDQFAAVIFDLDDTLYLERDYVRSGFQAVARWLTEVKNWCPRQARDFQRACWRLFLRGRRGRTFDHALAELRRPVDRSLVTQMVDCYRQHRPMIRVCCDVMPVLAHLGQARIPMALITDGPCAVQWLKIFALGLEPIFTEIVVTDQWGRDYWKPHERAFAHVESTLKVRASECLYIGDNPSKDFLAPRRRGWNTVRIQRSGGIHCHITSSPERRADHRFANLQQWLNDWTSHHESEPLPVGSLGTGAK